MDVMGCTEQVYMVTSERKLTKRQMAVIDEATSAVRNAG